MGECKRRKTTDKCQRAQDRKCVMNCGKIHTTNALYTRAVGKAMHNLMQLQRTVSVVAVVGKKG